MGRYQDAALRAPVSITKNGRPHTVLLSAHQFELLSKGRVALATAELDDATIEAIRQSYVPAEYAHLDALIDDWTP